MSATLLSLRQQIDAIDQAVVDLVAQRAALAAKVGENKQRSQSQIFRPERELGVLQNILAAKPRGLSEFALYAIWREIIATCRAQEGKFSVAIHSAADLKLITQFALRNFLGAMTSSVFYDDFAAAADSVYKAENVLVFVPLYQQEHINNSNATGAIKWQEPTLQFIKHSNLHIVSACVWNENTSGTEKKAQQVFLLLGKEKNAEANTQYRTSLFVDFAYSPKAEVFTTLPISCYHLTVNNVVQSCYMEIEGKVASDAILQCLCNTGLKDIVIRKSSTYPVFFYNSR